MSSICSCGALEVQQLTCPRSLAQGAGTDTPRGAVRYAKTGDGRDTPHKQRWICPSAICWAAWEGGVRSASEPQVPSQNGEVVVNRLIGSGVDEHGGKGKGCCIEIMEM